MTDQLPRIILPPTSDATQIIPPKNVPLSPVPTTPPVTSTPQTSPNVPLQPVPLVKKTEPLPSPDPAVEPKPVVKENTAPPAPQPSNNSKPIPKITPVVPPKIDATQLAQQEKILEQDLEKINKEENKILGTIKDWVSWLQGAETQKQTIAKELKELDRTLHADNARATTTQPPKSAGQSLEELQAQLQAAELAYKTIQDQQKIEEKKAFNNYEAGGLNRESLLKDMERTSALYDKPMQAAKAKITDIKNKLAQLQTANETPVPEPTPSTTTPSATTAQAGAPTQTTAQSAQPTPETTPEQPKPTPSLSPSNHILERLATLEQAQNEDIHKLLVELPQQGTNLTVQRSADGNGIIVLAGSETNYTMAQYFADADLIKAGLGGDDIANLPTGTLMGAQFTNPEKLDA